MKETRPERDAAGEGRLLLVCPIRLLYYKVRNIFAKMKNS
jgi:hypothetical protein